MPPVVMIGDFVLQRCRPEYGVQGRGWPIQGPLRAASRTVERQTQISLRPQKGAVTAERL